MKKIICPTDFSSASYNAIEYAAKLAAEHHAKLELVNLLTVVPAKPLASGIEALQNSEPAADTLNKVCGEISREFGIVCKYSIGATVPSLEKAISDIPEEGDLLIMGTNGIDDPHQYIFGTNSYHVVRKSNNPVLIIPEGVNYKPHPSVVFAWDYNEKMIGSFNKLKAILPLPGDIVFLHVSRNQTEISEDVYRAQKEKLITLFGDDATIRFKRLSCEDNEAIATTIDEYMRDSGADILVLNYYNRGIIRNIFHGSILKELSETARYSLLALTVKDNNHTF